MTHAERRAQNLNAERVQAAAEGLKQRGNLTAPIDAEFEEVVCPALLPPQTKIQGER
jgi:hypothetical protein